MLIGCDIHRWGMKVGQRNGNGSHETWRKGPDARAGSPLRQVERVVPTAALGSPHPLPNMGMDSRGSSVGWRTSIHRDLQTPRKLTIQLEAAITHHYTSISFQVDAQDNLIFTQADSDAVSPSCLSYSPMF
jgi:hypothetical protein